MRELLSHLVGCVGPCRKLTGGGDSGVDPLTPDDIAEIIVFMAGRRENVVMAETMVYPNHQASAGVMYRRAA